ncbi:hypothetical protein FFY45_14645 [Xanthomonas hortorum]|nr:hypothetical protein [Xanthomonas hortorum]
MFHRLHLERLTKLLRSRQAGAAGAWNRHLPLMHSGSPAHSTPILMTARYVFVSRCWSVEGAMSSPAQSSKSAVYK